MDKWAWKWRVPSIFLETRQQDTDLSIHLDLGITRAQGHKGGLAQCEARIFEGSTNCIIYHILESACRPVYLRLLRAYTIKNSFRPVRSPVPAPCPHRHLPLSHIEMTGASSSSAVAVACCHSVATTSSCVMSPPRSPNPHGPHLCYEPPSLPLSANKRKHHLSAFLSRRFSPAHDTVIVMELRKGIPNAPSQSPFGLFCCLHAQGGCIDASLDRGVGIFKVVFQIAEAFTMPIRPHYSDRY